ncbi:hypothetical protein BTN49_2259 [Candidatus Enterovibrio escicola]|uniref:tRNA 5-methylaminomethyl-2-thiouridine synthase TusB n=1 Tax=Candidatus Enterovibrio escicola TaxID=1927127 RepID=A0A2A5T234_9GAMM|nr:hypothetical protein BTN49_2259 [Candidatus Enterovibrio escacola]
MLVEDAVIAAVESGYWCSYLITSGYRVYVLIEDVKARGLNNEIASEFALIDINGFIDLTERHVTQMKW